MGACCSRESYGNGVDVEDAVADREQEDDEEDDAIIGDYGARVRLYGASKYTSMYTQQGRKVTNQDAMTVWEEFAGDKDMLFCGVFDGHGPYGHKVARHVRDTLPSRLSSAIRASQNNSFKRRDNKGKGKNSDDVNENQGDEDSGDYDDSSSLLLSSWETSFIKSFKEMDEELSLDASIDSFCSGTTAVSVIKEGNNLIIANLGDSRAILCSRGPRNQLVPVQLTVDLKPNITSEAERIKNSNGRVLALDQEPEVFRNRTLLTRSFSELTQVSVNHSELEACSDVSLAKLENYSEVSRASLNHSEIAAVPRKFRSKKRGEISQTAKTYLNSDENDCPPARLDKVNSSGPALIRQIRPSYPGNESVGSTLVSAIRTRQVDSLHREFLFPGPHFCGEGPGDFPGSSIDPLTPAHDGMTLMS
ncbi:hypothetical protein D5086_012673 [Populus alba]|uniref:Uncharacterized protein n=1 Tax=Populus alba TaxID=43335 RepID=A0ACC4C3Y6_POPAL